MKHNVKSLIGFTIGAKDGEIGKVKDFYFDDESWTIRYLIVDTGNWLSGRVVLISPEALMPPDLEKKIFPVNLTKEQIKNSPDVNTDVPVSRQEEIKLHKYYPWTAYWGAGYFGAGILPLATGSDPLAIGMPYEEFAEQQAQKDADADNRLRSTKKVTGYKVEATDGNIGKVEDFILGESMWTIHWLVVDTGKFLPGKKALISPKVIGEIEWEDSIISIETTTSLIKNGTEYDSSQLIHIIDEKQLATY